MTGSVQETRLKTVIMFSIQFGNASGAEISSSALNLYIPPSLFPEQAHFSLHKVPINHFTIIPIYLRVVNIPADHVEAAKSLIVTLARVLTCPHMP